jgi:hypothetical protein
MLRIVIYIYRISSECHVVATKISQNIYFFITCTIHSTPLQEKQYSVVSRYHVLMLHHERSTGPSVHFKSETITEHRSSSYVRQVPPLSSVNCTAPAIRVEMFTLQLLNSTELQYYVTP